MSKRITFTAIDPSGKTHTRTSDVRTYSHTVVYQRSKDTAMASAISKSNGEFDGRNYDYDVEKAAGTHEHVTRVPEASSFHVSYSAEHIAKTQASYRAENAKRIADAKAVIEAYPTKEAYISAKRAARIAAVEATDFTIWHNLGWCGRPDLAAKLAGKTPGAVILEAKTSA